MFFAGRGCKMAQTLTAIQNHYRGVSCSRCGQPIPVFTIVGNLKGQLHSFALRCRVCEKKGIYTVADIRSFDGDPGNPLPGFDEPEQPAPQPPKPEMPPRKPEEPEFPRPDPEPRLPPPDPEPRFPEPGPEPMPSPA